MKVKVLGSYGNYADSSGTTCFQLSEKVLLDAGTIFRFLTTDSEKIEHVFLTHTHLDHIAELPFLIDMTLDFRKNPLRVYGCFDSIKSLRENIFNDLIWPDFTSIEIPKSSSPAMEYVIIKEGEPIQIEDFTIIPFKANHTVPTFGYIVKQNSKGFILSGDTYKNDNLWEILNNDEEIKALVIDVSFPSFLRNRAILSKHLTPEDLRDELCNLKRSGIRIYVYHLKPFYLDAIEKELVSYIQDIKVLKGGETITV